MSHKRPAFEIDPEYVPSRWTPRRLALLAAALGSLPFLYEAAALCASRWSVLTGRRWTASTPWLDWAAGLVDHVVGSVRRTTNRSLSDLPWEPTVVFVAGLTVAFFASLPLRRGS